MRLRRVTEGWYVRFMITVLHYLSVNEQLHTILIFLSIISIKLSKVKEVRILADDCPLGYNATLFLCAIFGIFVKV